MRVERRKVGYGEGEERQRENSEYAERRGEEAYIVGGERSSDRGIIRRCNYPVNIIVIKGRRAEEATFMRGRLFDKRPD
ncbi:hypothetical protein GW17_00061048 [Ensete ventricosum]|nr:hypothetical protein GW17_00061048 [Ensete ventricosum]